MQFVGARFGDPRSAELALDELRARFDLGPEDAGLEPLGSTAYDVSRPDDVLLAGRFSDDRLAELRNVVEEHGGEIVARTTSPAAPAQGGCEPPVRNADPLGPGESLWSGE